MRQIKEEMFTQSLDPMASGILEVLEFHICFILLHCGAQRGDSVREMTPGGCGWDAAATSPSYT